MLFLHKSLVCCKALPIAVQKHHSNCLYAHLDMVFCNLDSVGRENKEMSTQAACFGLHLIQRFVKRHLEWIVRPLDYIIVGVVVIAGCLLEVINLIAC